MKEKMFKIVIVFKNGMRATSCDMEELEAHAIAERLVDDMSNNEAVNSMYTEDKMNISFKMADVFLVMLYNKDDMPTEEPEQIVAE